MKRKGLILSLILLVLGTGVLFGKSSLLVFITDMYNQKNIKPQEQESMISFPIDSVTRKGHIYENLEDPQVLTSWIGRETNAETTTKNPIQATPESIADGKYMYTVYCHVCHGNLQKANAQGLGDSKVNKKGMYAVFLPIMLPSLSDGYIFYKAKYGSGAIMPPLGYAMTDQERWNIVNYLRSVIH